MKKRILSLVLILSLLIGAAARPQRADAVVATTAAVAASAAAILTACGVSYWAATQTDAVDYIAGKIDEYLASIDEPDMTYEEWLEIGGTSQIFDVVTGGVMQFGAGVANKLLDFCRWLQNDEGIESGGSIISSGGTKFYALDNGYVSGSLSIAVLDGNILHVSFDNFCGVNSQSAIINYYFVPELGINYKLTVTQSNILPSNTNLPRWAIYTSQGIPAQIPSNAPSINAYPYVNTTQNQTANTTNNILYLAFRGGSTAVTGYIDLSLEGGVFTVDNVAITPSDFVNIPAAIDTDSVFTVKAGVDLASGDSVDDAAEAILDGITSENGLSSTVEDTPDTSWGWLYTLLINIAEAITDGVADIKQAVLGLADSIYSKFTTVLQDIKTGISTIVNSITSAVSQLLSAIQSLPTTIYSQFTQILQDIKTGIQGIALDIYTDLINALTYVFVPSQTFIDTYVASLYATFDNHFSILSYPFSILGEFITRASGIGSPEPMFTWGNIYEPFSGKLLIAAGSYNLNSMLSNQTFAQVYSIYMIVVKGLISFAFLKFLYSWFCDVFKMHEDDFSSPFDVEEEDDGADFDGYDGYYTS